MTMASKPVDVKLSDIAEWLDARNGRLVSIEWQQDKRGKWIAVAVWTKIPPVA